MFNTPVLFLIFNRPDLTALVFEAIRQAKPPILLIVADGPRHEQERVKTAAARAAVESIDWPCTVLKNYSNSNLGPRARISSGITWAFELVEECIILEDDCLPHPDFFGFCEALLIKYRDNQEVFHIGGTCLKESTNNFSYEFTSNTYVWGWATWRRAWRFYDVNMQSWPSANHDQLVEKKFPKKKRISNFWNGMFEVVHSRKYDTCWDYQWLFTTWYNNGISIGTNKNLITNLGFRPDATHTHNPGMFGAGLAAYPMPIIIHPPAIRVNEQLDEWVVGNLFIGKQSNYFLQLKRRFVTKGKNIIKRFIANV